MTQQTQTPNSDYTAAVLDVINSVITEYTGPTTTTLESLGNGCTAFVARNERARLAILFTNGDCKARWTTRHTQPLHLAIYPLDYLDHIDGGPISTTEIDNPLDADALELALDGLTIDTAPSTVHELTALIDPAAATLAVAHMLRTYGRTASWDADTTYNLLNNLMDAKPAATPSITSQSDDDLAYWHNLT